MALQILQLKDVNRCLVDSIVCDCSIIDTNGIEKRGETLRAEYWWKRTIPHISKKKRKKNCGYRKNNREREREWEWEYVRDERDNGHTQVNQV